MRKGRSELNSIGLLSLDNSGVGTLSSISTETTSNIRFTGLSAITIEGFSNGSNGKHLLIQNVACSTFVLKNLTGVVAEQIETSTGLDFPLAAGAALLLVYDGISQKWRIVNPVVQQQGGGGGKTVTAVQVGPAAYTASANEIVRVDSTANAFTVTLPAAPANGAEIEIVDVGGSVATNNVTIGRNGFNINGVAADVAFDVNYDRTVLIFSTSLGWGLN